MFTDNSEGVNVLTMFPGDTVRVPVELVIDLQSNSGGDMVGSFSARYEFRTRFPIPAPEPSAALSLPIGALTLLGLASLRG